MPPWTLTRPAHRGDRSRATPACRRRRSTGCCRTSACAGRTRRSSGCRRSEVAHYEGMTIAEIARDRGADPTETYLDLVGELGSQTRIMNWNYSGRDDEETSLRKVLQHPPHVLRDRHHPHRQRRRQPGIVRHLPAHSRPLRARAASCFSLAEAVRRMTSLSARAHGAARSRPHRQGTGRRSRRFRPSNRRRQHDAALPEPFAFRHRIRRTQRFGRRTARCIRQTISRWAGPAARVAAGNATARRCCLRPRVLQAL